MADLDVEPARKKARTDTTCPSHEKILYSVGYDEYGGYLYSIIRRDNGNVILKCEFAPAGCLVGHCASVDEKYLKKVDYVDLSM